MKIRIALLSTILVGMFSLEDKLEAQLFLDWEGGPGVSELSLNPNQAGQVRTFYIRNTSGSPVGNIFGLNFAAQVGDGSSGPRVTDVSLYAGNSIFSAFSGNQKDQDSTPWIKFFGIDDGSGNLSIPASSSTVLAQLTFDTTGLNPEDGPWGLKFQNIQVGAITSDSIYVKQGGGEFLPIDNFMDGQITVVPEPAAYGFVVSLLVLGFAWCRRSAKKALDYQETSPS